MRIYLAATSAAKGLNVPWKRTNVLESYHYIKPWQIDLMNEYKSFILDSGAFTFMSKKTNIDFDDYTKRYGQFVKQHDIKLFFELDIDSVVTWEKYLDLRKRLEDITGKDPIPVFHRSRGKTWYEKAVKKHTYIAIGGLAIKHIKKTEYKYLEWFITKAHANGCKIHGLGFTDTDWLSVLKWDSVDSSTWASAARFGHPQIMVKGRPERYRNDVRMSKQSGKYAPQGKRCTLSKEALHELNFTEWVKYSEHMERAYARS